MSLSRYSYSFFFFHDPAPTDIYTLSLHDALPISPRVASAVRTSCRARPQPQPGRARPTGCPPGRSRSCRRRDRKSTRLNSSHGSISYAVFCLKKKKKKKKKKTKCI